MSEPNGGQKQLWRFNLNQKTIFTLLNARRMNKPISAKKFLHEYVRKRGISKYEFATSLGLPANFLDEAETITVESLQKILSHRNYQDFNYHALLKGEGEVIRDSVKCPKDAVAQSFIQDTRQKLQSVKSGENALSHPEAIALLERAMEKLNDLSLDYQGLEENYLKIKNWLKKEFKFKK